MNNVPEGTHDPEMIAVLRKALDVAGAKLSLRKPLTVLATAAAIGLAATIAADPQFSGTVAAGVARSVIGGVILGSNAWPSVPVDVQSRLVLWSPDCRQCGWVSAIDWHRSLAAEVGSVEYAITVAFLLAVVAGSFAAVILAGYGIAQLIGSAL
jgi:hypothetical protein